MTRFLGPLELVGERWVIGDPQGKDGLSILLTPDGLEQHRRDEAAPLRAIEWSEFVELGIRAAYRRWQTTRAAGLLAGFSPAADVSRAGCSLRGFMRGAYEPQSVRYSHHTRHYTGGHVIVLKALFDVLSEQKTLDRLGDPEWLGAVVATLSTYTSWYAPRGKRLVKETVRSLGG